MAKINMQKQVMTIKHPVMPEVWVEAYILDPMESMDLFSGMQKFQRVVVLTHPTLKDENGEPQILKDDDNNPLTHVISNLPASAVIDILMNTLTKRWGGINDENDNPIPFSQANLRVLFSKELNVPTTRKINGKDVKGTQAFADYIQAEVNKASTDEPDVPNEAS